MYFNFKAFLVGVVVGWFIGRLYEEYYQYRTGYYPEFKTYLRFIAKIAGVWIGLILVIWLYLFLKNG